MLVVVVGLLFTLLPLYFINIIGIILPYYDSVIIVILIISLIIIVIIVANKI